MKLVFIYGPPAAGKLTVAAELADLTNFKLFHNHLTVDLVRALFDFGTEPFTKLVRVLRLQVLTSAAEAGLDGLIFTFVYSHPLSEPFVRNVLRLTETHAVEICFVHLVCRPEELEKRVSAESRRRYRKLTDWEKLRPMLETAEMLRPISFVESLTLDSSEIAPAETASQIASHYSLTKMIA